MKKLWYLVIAVIGNGLGSAIMDETNLGMSAWGTSASNVGSFFDISIGVSFIIVSIVFYIIAIIVRRKFVLVECIQSIIFLVSFGVVLDLFKYVLPDTNQLHIVIRFFINLGGLLILMFSIALHLKVNLAVHPMDVYLKTMQEAFRSVAIGTYFAYGTAFVVAVLFGLLAGSIQDVGIGTVMTLLFGGLIMAFYNKTILQKVRF